MPTSCPAVPLLPHLINPPPPFLTSSAVRTTQVKQAPNDLPSCKRLPALTSYPSRRVLPGGYAMAVARAECRRRVLSRPETATVVLRLGISAPVARRRLADRV